LRRSGKKSVKKSKKVVVIDEDVPLEDNALPDAESEVARQVEEQGVAPQGKAKAKAPAKTKAKTTSKATSKAPAKKKSSQKVTTGRVTKNKGKKVVTKRVTQLLESVASEGEEAAPQESGQGENVGASIPKNVPALPVKNSPTSTPEPEPVAGDVIPEVQKVVLEGGGENHDSSEEASDDRASNEAVVSREGSTEQQDDSEGEDPEEVTLAKMAREALKKQERAERERERVFFLSNQDSTSEDRADGYNDTSNYFDGEDDDEEGDPDDYI
jgi:hypothetical protein